jgi:hypothetical protein
MGDKKERGHENCTPAIIFSNDFVTQSVGLESVSGLSAYIVREFVCVISVNKPHGEIYIVTGCISPHNPMIRVSLIFAMLIERKKNAKREEKE